MNLQSLLLNTQVSILHDAALNTTLNKTSSGKTICTYKPWVDLLLESQLPCCPFAQTSIPRLFTTKTFPRCTYPRGWDCRCWLGDFGDRGLVYLVWESFGESKEFSGDTRAGCYECFADGFAGTYAISKSRGLSCYDFMAAFLYDVGWDR